MDSKYLYYIVIICLAKLITCLRKKEANPWIRLDYEESERSLWIWAHIAFAFWAIPSASLITTSLICFLSTAVAVTTRGQNCCFSAFIGNRYTIFMKMKMVWTINAGARGISRGKTITSRIFTHITTTLSSWLSHYLPLKKVEKRYVHFYFGKYDCIIVFFKKKKTE